MFFACRAVICQSIRGHIKFFKTLPHHLAILFFLNQAVNYVVNTGNKRLWRSFTVPIYHVIFDLTSTFIATEGYLLDRLVKFAFDSLKKSFKELHHFFLLKGWKNQFEFFLFVHRAVLVFVLFDSFNLKNCLEILLFLTFIKFNH